MSPIHSLVGRHVRFVYRNWKGETAERYVLVTGFAFGATEWHPEPQWLMLALDVLKREDRSFALRDIDTATLLTIEPD